MRLWRRFFAGQVAPGWLSRETGWDQPDLYDPDQDGWPPGTNGDQDWSPDQAAPPYRPDRPYTPEDHWTDRSRRPLVPDAFRTPVEAAKFAAKHAAWIAGFHVMRIPKYAALNLLWAPRGATRLLIGFTRWLSVSDQRDVVWAAGQHARHSGEDHQFRSYLRLQQERKATGRERTALAVLLVGAMALAGWTAVQRWDSTVALAVALLVVLGYQGRPMDRPYIESAVVSVPGARKITPDMIITALHAAKLCKETVGPDAPEFAAPGVYREGAGFGAVIDLPFGYTAERAIARKTDIAAGLRVSDFRLFVAESRRTGGHAGQIEMWIADEDPHAAPAQVSPLVKAARSDLWSEVPFGVNEKGRMVSLLLMWTSVLIGALPRMGKTFALRLLLAAAALDPYVRLLLWDGKGGKDHAPFERVAHAFGCGPDDEVARSLLETAKTLVADMNERYRKMRALPHDVCPDAKLTPALARDPKMNMPVTVLAIDEFQVYLENRKYGQQILDALLELAQRGSGAGIILILATQKPSSTAMKTDFRDILGTRFGMRVMTREHSEMILGSGTYKAGLDCSKFLPSHKGVGILLGADDGPLADKGGQTLHTHLMDLPQVAKLCERARALREGAGTLSGVAAGEADEALSDRFLEHVNAAFRGEDKAHSDVLCARLAEDHPGLYADPDTGRPAWDPIDLAAALARYGIRGGNQIWASRLEDGAGANRKGFYRQPVMDALAERAAPIPDSPDDWAD